MKKQVLVLVLATIVVGGAFAQEKNIAWKFSAGGGAYFTSDFGGGLEVSVPGMDMYLKTPYAGGGIFAFLDATYAELSFGFFGGGGDVKVKNLQMLGFNKNVDSSVSGLDIGLLGKYPIAIDEKLTVFPILGITIRAILSAEQNGKDVKKPGSTSDAAGDMGALWFKFGGGLDYSLTEKLFLRGNLLYGVRLASEYENDWSDLAENFASGYNINADINTLTGHGLELKVAVGYKL